MKTNSPGALPFFVATSVVDGIVCSDLWVFDPYGGVTPQFLSARRESGTSVRLLWQGEAGRRYGFQSRTSLTSGAWTRQMFSAGTNSFLATNTVVEATVNVPSADTLRFFRAIEAD